MTKLSEIIAFDEARIGSAIKREYFGFDCVELQGLHPCALQKRLVCGMLSDQRSLLQIGREAVDAMGAPQQLAQGSWLREAKFDISFGAAVVPSEEGVLVVTSCEGLG